MICRRAVLLASASLCLGTALPAMAQTATPAAAAAAATGNGQINGTVTDANGNLVVGATVRIEGSNIVEATGPGGRFTIRSAPAGQQRVTVRFFGADTVTQTVTVQAGQSVDLAIRLGSADPTSGEIVVSA